MDEKAKEAEDLEALEERFREWRGRRRRGEHIPPALWAAAAGIACQHGVARTAKRLGLNAYGLRKRMEEAAGQEPTAEADPKFVELAAMPAEPAPAPFAAGVHECVVELHNARGREDACRTQRGRPGRLGASVPDVLGRDMIQVTPHMRVLLAVEPVDFRAGIDGLAAVCRKRLAADPFSGVMFIFGNRRRTAIRILVYDGQGFWLCSKRLSTGKFAFWPSGEAPTRPLQACELQVLLMAGNPAQANTAPAWRPLDLAV